MKKLLNLCLIHKDDEILLAMKKRGFGAGRWNGFGGKIKKGESIEKSAIREVKEESGIKAKKLEKKGIIEFEFNKDPEILEVHIFNITDYYGDPQETEEMKPQWFPIKGIPYNQMWPDDQYWIPIFLEGKYFKGKFLFENNEENKIIEYKLKEVKNGFK